MKRHMIDITDENHGLLKVLAKKEERSMRYLINRALKNFLKAKKVLES